jgi:ADP-ribose pyrophosphatase YjhB (NUDIX family)
VTSDAVASSDILDDTFVHVLVRVLVDVDRHLTIDETLEGQASTQAGTTTSVSCVSDDVEHREPLSTRDLVRWSEALAAIARTGLGFTQNLYERERFEEVLRVAADIKMAADEVLLAAEDRREHAHLIEEWMTSIGVDVPGYVTPKVAIGAVVGNDRGEILLVQRADSGYWLYPTGWADVGYSPAEVAVKEVVEETGIACVPEQLLAVIDGQRMGFSRFAMYMLLFHCRATGGELAPHPLETADVGWFAEGRLPPGTLGAAWWGPKAFGAIRGERYPTAFDDVRSPVWRG